MTRQPYLDDDRARAAGDLVLAALDALVQRILDAGVLATRNPGDFQPPGALVAAPTIAGAATMSSIALDVPVFVVSDVSGADGLEWMIGAVVELLPVLRESAAQPTLWTSPINPAGLPAYLITVQLNVSTS